MSAAGRRHEMAGVIASAGFESGDRLVVGHWSRSPVGPFSDLMWARPDGTRVLLSPDRRSEAFITSVYGFDEHEVVALDARGDERGVRVVAGAVELEVRAGRAWRLPWGRPEWFVRRVEGPVAWATMGVRTYGTSPRGVLEWYQADAYRPAVAARGAVDGTDLGAAVPLDPPLGVGFTDPPRRPSIVRVRPLLEDPRGELDELIRRTR